MLGKILGAADNARLIPYWLAHDLGLVELRILEGSETDQAIGQWSRQICLGAKNLVGQHQSQRLR
jgi:hypothetical protein